MNVRHWFRALIQDPRDLHVYGGLGLIAVGTWQIFPPAALIVFGLGLCFVGVRYGG